MSSLLGTTASGTAVLAHPVSGHPHVEVPTLLLTVGAGLLVAMVLPLVPAGRTAGYDAARATSWDGPLSRGQLVTRAVAVATLLVAVLTGLFGTRDQLDNLAPALVVGTAWPALTVLALVLPVWRWVDPWDATARLLLPDDRSTAAADVWPALVPALGWAWFVAVHPRPLDPRLVGTALLAYTTLTLVGCLLVGRRRWLSSGEPIGILLTWVTAAVRGGLREDRPAGAPVLVGAVLGGLLFGLLGRTESWTDLTGGSDPMAWGTAGLVVCAAVGAGALALAGVLGRRLGDHGASLRGALVLLVGVVLVVTLARNRLTTSLQLLPGLLGDPFGRGWDLLGPAGAGLDAAPFGATGLLWLRIAVLGGLVVAASVVAARGVPQPVRAPAFVALACLSVASMLAVALH
ncbi:MAG: hypothetical protein ACLGH4_04350 [Actinomycetes bacterium]